MPGALVHRFHPVFSWIGLDTFSTHHKYQLGIVPIEGFNTLKAFYGWLRRSNGYPMNKPLPTHAIDLERQLEPEADPIEGDDLAQIWQVLEFEEKTAVRDASGTWVRDRAIIGY